MRSIANRNSKTEEKWMAQDWDRECVNKFVVHCFKRETKVVHTKRQPQNHVISQISNPSKKWVWTSKPNLVRKAHAMAKLSKTAPAISLGVIPNLNPAD
jgi:hypothetical protein